MDTLLAYPKPETLLPHRDPMLLVEKIEHFEAGDYLIASTSVQEDLPFFKGHFPGHPMLPGVVLVEMMFQTCGLFGRMESQQTAAQTTSPAAEESDRKRTIGRAIKIDKTSFLKPVYPNTKLKIKVSFKQKLRAFSQYNARVEDEAGDVVAKGLVTVHLKTVKI